MRIMSDNNKNEKKFYKEFFVKDVLKAGGFEVWNELKIGQYVKFKADGDRVAVMQGECTIGYIPENEGNLLNSFLKMGYENIFEAAISNYDEKKNIDSRITIAVYIKKKDKTEEKDKTGEKGNNN